ncbi:MAG: hypothetical protein ACXVFA_12720, partial [Solirubrobacteraceae bacterium]
MSSVRPVPSKERGSTLPLPSFKSSHDGRELGFVSTIRARLGSLSRQFALAVAIVVAPVLLGLIVIFLLMVVSGHEVAIVAGIVVVAGVVAAIVARLLARGILLDIHAIRDGLTAVRRGEHDVEIVTAVPDELGELAAAANAMIGRL